MVRELDRGLMARLTETTLEQASRVYLLSAAQRFRPATLKQHASALGLFTRYAGPETLLSALTAQEVLSFLDHCRVQRQNGSSALRGKLKVLRDFFAWATKSGRIPATPLSGVTLPRRERPHVEPLPREVIARLIEELRREVQDRSQDWLALRDLVMVLLLYGLGLRLGELRRLQWGDLGHSPQLGRYFVIRAEISKGGYSEGIAPLTDDLVVWLTKWAKARERILPAYLNPHVLVADAAKSSGANAGSPMSGSAIQRRLKRIFAKYGLNGLVQGSVHPHRFRHSFAVEHLMDENDLKTVSRLLRHRSPQTTLLTYSNFTDPQIATKARRHNPLNGLL